MMLVQKAAKNILGIALFPCVLVCIFVTLHMFGQLSWMRYPQTLFFVGAGLYGGIYYLNKGESFLYVLGHELLHAIASIACGGKIIPFFVSHTRGFVKLTRANIVVSLVPYCIPFYAALLFLIYYAVSFAAPTRKYIPAFILLLGCSFMHHILFTVKYLKNGQSDVRMHGTIFSLVVILLCNCMSIVFITSVFFDSISFLTWVKTVCQETKKAYFFLV